MHRPATRALVVVMLSLPFLLANSCVKDVYVLFEYDLDRCPPLGFELPQHVRMEGWDANAEEGEPYCHGFTRYELNETHSPQAFEDPGKLAFVYARLRKVEGHGCGISVISSASCAPKEALEDCEKRIPKLGIFANRQARAKDYTELIVDRLLIAQNFHAKLPAAYSRTIGRTGDLKEWCKDPDSTPPGEKYPGAAQKAAVKK